jgi:hypothetical protein
MASKLSDRSINKNDVETLFRDVLTLEQVKRTGNLLKLLGLYVFVDRKQLDFFAERHFGEKIGLSTLQNAVKYNLVSEIQSEDDFQKYYFQLKTGGYFFLESIKFQYRLLPLDAAVNEREKLLSINNYLMEKKYKLVNAPFLFEPLITANNLMLLHKRTKDDGFIQQLLTEHPSLTIEKMYLKDVQLSSNSRGNLDSMLQE